MNLSRNLIQGAAGGLLGGSVLGVVEAFYLLATSGAPDLLSPFYASVLYGLIGLPLGLGAGVVLAILQKFKAPDDKHVDSLAFAFGEVGAIAPMGLFILMYLANKVVYAEAGVPLTGKLAILAIVGVASLGQITLGAKLLRGPFSFLLKGPGVLGTWLALVVALFGLSFVSTGGDPRSGWDHGKPVPAGLEDAPSVLLITVDTLRADHLGTYGMDGDPTPVLDGIAKDGIVFENAFAAASWTRSSFASLFTSRIPSSHNTDAKASMMPDDLDMLSEVLHEAGVTTANLANNINVTSTFNFDQGYDTFIYEAPDYSFGATESVFGLTFYKVVHKLNERLGGAKEVGRFYQPAEVVLDDAKGFIEANRDSRFLLGVHLMEPHDPYFEHPYLRGEGDAEFNGIGYARAEHEHPDPADAAYLQEVYLQEIVHMDKKLAPFVEWLKSEGLYDELMIVVTADHGEEFGEHDGFWHGVTLYEEQIHVPLLIKPPGRDLRRVRVPWQARLIDVAPTIATAMGVEPSPQWEGADLLDTVLAEREAAKAAGEALVALKTELYDLRAKEADGTLTEEEAVLLEEKRAAYEDSGADPDPCDAYDVENERPVIAEQDFEGNVISAIRRDGFKFIEANEGNPRGLPTAALFDMVEDAAEADNLVDSDDQRCGRYLDGLDDGLQEEMQGAIEAAAARATSGGEAELSCEEISRLCALGYMSGPDCEKCQ